MLWSSVNKRQHFQWVSATEALLILLRRQRVIKDAIAKRLHSGVHKSLLTADPGLKNVLYNKEINGLRWSSVCMVSPLNRKMWKTKTQIVDFFFVIIPLIIKIIQKKNIRTQLRKILKF